MTPRSLILMKAFWFYGSFSEAMSFSKFATSVSKVTIGVLKTCHCLASPVKVCALALKNEDSMNEEKHSLRNSAVLQSREGTQRNSSLPHDRDFWYKRSKFWKWHCFRKMALESKRLHQHHWSWCHFAGKSINYAFLNSLIWFSPWFLWNWWS